MLFAVDIPFFAEHFVVCCLSVDRQYGTDGSSKGQRPVCPVLALLRIRFLISTA